MPTFEVSFFMMVSFLKTINIMILKDAPFLISTYSFVLRSNKATYTYAITLFRQLGYIYMLQSSDIPCTYHTESLKDTKM